MSYQTKLVTDLFQLAMASLDIDLVCMSPSYGTPRRGDDSTPAQYGDESSRYAAWCQMAAFTPEPIPQSPPPDGVDFSIFRGAKSFFGYQSRCLPTRVWEEGGYLILHRSDVGVECSFS